MKNRNGLLFIIIIVVIVTALVVYQRSSGAVLSSTPNRILAIGDSLTSGIPQDGGATPWPSHLATALGADVVNLSYPGDTINASFNRWESTIRSGRLKPNDPSWRPDVIVILLGGNDIRSSAQPNNMTEGLVRYAELLSNYEVPILFVAVPGGVIGDRYKSVWSDAASQTGNYEMSRATIRRIFTNSRYTIADRIHFNDEGQRYFAEIVRQRLVGR